MKTVQFFPTGKPRESRERQTTYTDIRVTHELVRTGPELSPGDREFVERLLAHRRGDIMRGLEADAFGPAAIGGKVIDGSAEHVPDLPASEDKP